MRWPRRTDDGVAQLHGPVDRVKDLRQSQIHSIERASGKVSFDAERTTWGGYADRFWAIALACQKERGSAPKTGTEIGVRVVD
ncbi:MAG: hypothetical protein OXU20_23730 [Myxococcales bacterium]|nr:hypothetical protein [Myxococcales bacterium]